MREAFDFTLEQYVYFGSYPAVAEMIGNEGPWGKSYLSQVTDLYFHKIMGWSVGPKLDSAYSLGALELGY